MPYIPAALVDDADAQRDPRRVEQGSQLAAQPRESSMEPNVEGPKGNTERLGTGRPRLPLEEAHADELSVRLAQMPKRPLDVPARLSLLERLVAAPDAGFAWSFRPLELEQEIRGTTERLALRAANRVVRDPERDDMEPRVDARVRPLETMEALEHLDVGGGERLLRERRVPESSEQNAIETCAVAAQQLTECLALSLLRARAHHLAAD